MSGSNQYTFHQIANIFPLMEGRELETLAADIKKRGLLQSVVLHEDKILDGRNRWRACEQVGIKPKTKEYKGDDPLGFVVSMNLARRHLSESQRTMIAAELATVPKGRREANMPIGIFEPEAAKLLNVSVRSIQRAKEVLGTKDKEMIAAVKSGKKKLGAVVTEIKRAEQVGAIKKELPPLPKGPFRVIVADPPWSYRNRADDGTHRARNDYPMESVQEIIEGRDVPGIAHEDSILWLWTTNAFMRQAYEVADAWGFEVKTILTWIKNKMGLGDWLRGQTEHCLMCVRGKPTVTLTNQTTALSAPSGKHSAKPDEFYAMVETLCPGSRCELYARKERPGWICHGLI